MKRAFLLVTAIFIGIASYAQSGALDPTFGVNNLYLSQFQGPGGGYCLKHKVLADDKILGVGYVDGLDANVYVFRLNPHGTIDTTFGNMGTVELDPSIGGEDYGFDLEVLSSGKIVICVVTNINNNFETRVIKLNADGTLDDSFGNFGTVFYKHNNLSTYLGNIDVDSQGRIVWAGIYENNSVNRWLVLRLNEDGSFDNTFSSDGIQEFVNFQNGEDEFLNGLAIAPDNSIFLLGDNSPLNDDATVILAKVNTSGNIDISYGTQGRYLRTIPQGVSYTYFDMEVHANGEVLCSGTEDDKAVILKVAPQGVMDMGFGTAGKVENLNADIFSSVKQFSADKIAAIGNNSISHDLVVAVYNEDGTLDANFGNQGEAIHLLHPDISNFFPYSLDFQSSGNMIVCGNLTLSPNVLNPQVVAVRILNPGYTSVEENITTNFSIYPNPTVQSFQINTTNDDNIEKVTLLSMSGKQLQVWNNVNGQYHLPENMAAGMYIVRIQTGKTFSNQILSVVR